LNATCSRPALWNSSRTECRPRVLMGRRAWWAPHAQHAQPDSRSSQASPVTRVGGCPLAALPPEAHAPRAQPMVRCKHAPGLPSPMAAVVPSRSRGCVGRSGTTPTGNSVVSDRAGRDRLPVPSCRRSRPMFSALCSRSVRHAVGSVPPRSRVRLMSLTPWLTRKTAGAPEGVRTAR